MRKSMILRI